MDSASRVFGLTAEDNTRYELGRIAVSGDDPPSGSHQMSGNTASLMTPRASVYLDI